MLVIRLSGTLWALLSRARSGGYATEDGAALPLDANTARHQARLRAERGEPVRSVERFRLDEGVTLAAR
jgi:hypothetical protein